MLVIIPLCLAIASSSWAQDSSIDEHDADSMFGEPYQLDISELGRRTEESLNCFLQFDQLLANNWTAEFNLGGNFDVDPTLVNRFRNDEETEKENLPKARGLANDIRICMNNVTKKAKNPAIEKCMRNLVNSEIEMEDFISAPDQFDNSEPLPFLTFLDIRELVKLLFQNRDLKQLNPEEIKVYQLATGYLSEDTSDRDKVFILDQTCEWKNLVALQKRANNPGEQMKEFASQVIRSISLQIANAVIIAKDLKPGRWITVYRRWVPMRLKNLKELESIIDTDLKSKEYTAEELCKYATVLATYFAEDEVKIIVPEKTSAINLATSDLRARIFSEEDRLCRNSATTMCSRYRNMKESYSQDLQCVKSFGELLTNHFLNLIMKKYAGPDSSITYPERVCKKTAPFENLVVRYCRCVGSFCTSRDIGEIKANTYKFNQTTTVVTRA